MADYLQVSTEEEKMKQITRALSEDGLESADAQKRLLHVWGKLERTENALKEAVKEVSWFLSHHVCLLV